jgi:hypothetical protein
VPAELFRRRTTDCLAVADVLPALAAGEVELGRSARAHVETCLRCQAEVARYRYLLRTLRALRDDPLPPAPGTLAAIMSSIESAGDLRRMVTLRRARRHAYVGGFALATAAGATLMLWISRRRPELLTG